MKRKRPEITNINNKKNSTIEKAVIEKENSCVVCGEIIPEGRMVCNICMSRYLKTNRREKEGD